MADLTVQNIEILIRDKEDVYISTPADYNAMISYLKKHPTPNILDDDGEPSMRRFVIDTEIDFNWSKMNYFLDNDETVTYCAISGDVVKRGIVGRTNLSAEEITLFPFGNETSVTDLQLEECVMKGKSVTIIDHRGDIGFTNLSNIVLKNNVINLEVDGSFTFCDSGNNASWGIAGNNISLSNIIKGAPGASINYLTGKKVDMTMFTCLDDVKFTNEKDPNSQVVSQINFTQNGTTIKYGCFRNDIDCTEKIIFHGLNSEDANAFNQVYLSIDLSDVLNGEVNALSGTLFSQTFETCYYNADAPMGAWAPDHSEKGLSSAQLKDLNYMKSLGWDA